MKLRLELKPIMEQRIELRLVQHLQGDLEDKWLTGNPRDLETLLNTQPPMSKRGNVNYILGGGWASEILTGNVREHHDLDVVKQLGFNYRFCGVFIEQGKWKRLLLHPILALGVYFLRGIVGIVYLFRGLLR